MFKDNSISALIAKLDASREMKHDEKRLYKPTIQDVREDQYFRIEVNYEYSPRIEWSNSGLPTITGGLSQKRSIIGQ